jgi:hypothetical protein
MNTSQRERLNPRGSVADERVPFPVSPPASRQLWCGSPANVVLF